MAAKKKSRKASIKPPLSPKRQLFAVPPPPESVQPSPLTVVGVGASAGGLEAFSGLLQGLPRNPGVAIVFVQHLAPQHESALVPLLSAQSTLRVTQATHGQDVEANHVYVIPPNSQMVIVGRTLQVNARPDDRSQYTPVDAFLSSLAEAAGPSHRRDSLRHRIGRGPGDARHQGIRRPDDRAETGVRKIRRHAEGGDCDRDDSTSC